MADKPARDVNVNAVPQNLEAEQCLLGCILLDDNLAQELVPTLKAEDFYAPSHRILLSAMQKVLNESKPIDFVTVADALAQRRAAGCRRRHKLSHHVKHRRAKLCKLPSLS